jgi:hypothetical protein
VILLDVNLWIPALRIGHPQHRFVTEWMSRIRAEGELIGVSELALSGAVRLLTHPKVFDPPSDPGTAMDASRNAIDAPGTRIFRPGSGTGRASTAWCGGRAPAEMMCRTRITPPSRSSMERRWRPSTGGSPASTGSD